MNRLKNICIILTASLFFLFPASSASASADEEVVKIQKAYENIKDIRGSFVQKSYIKDLKRTDTFQGQFFIKRPTKMKWSYKGQHTPRKFSLIIAPITIYQKKEKQAFKGKFDRETYGQAPIALLSGFGNIREEFTFSEKNEKLILTPKKPMGGILTIEIERSEGEFPIQSFTINDSYSNRIEMKLKDIKINTGLEDALFELSLPKSVTVYEPNL